jgi:hypothetical protein
MDRQARIVAGKGKDMTREDIIRMARETGDVETDRRGRETFTYDSYGLERFAALVAAAEREACAKAAETTVCDTHLPTGVQIYSGKRNMT